MARDDEETTMDLSGLEKLEKLLKAKPPTVRVGILGAKAGRQSAKGGPNNAEVGAFHEFGTADLPVRSFLRMPLANKLPARLEKQGAFDAAVLKEAIQAGNLIPFMKKIGVEAEGIVADAFASGGFGQWKPSNMDHKKNHETLVESQQLRNSITSDVKE